MDGRRWSRASSATVGLALLLAAGACSTDGADGQPSSSGQVPDEVEPTDDTRHAIGIPTEDLELAGALHLPEGDGPHPAVVIVHGSGPQSSRGEQPGQLGLTLPQPVAVYQELADGLGERGYGALTYDKRTCGAFNDCADNDYPAPDDDLTIDTFVDDAVAAVELLEDDDRVDEVIVLGHSQGGTIALAVAARTEPDAVVLVATPRSPIDEVLAQQAATFRELLRAAGQGESEAGRQQVGQLEQLADDVAALRSSGPAEPDEPIGGASPGFWRSWLELGDRAPELLSETAGPVLVLGGEQDWNVPADDVRAWRDDLRDRDALHIQDGITHALTRLDATDPADITPGDLGTDVDPGVLATLTEWLDQQE